MVLLIEKLNEKLAYFGQSKRWFWETFLPNMPYSSMMNQINGFTPATPRLLEAIKEYLAK